jgi:CheY-like chemotaxis protein
MKVSGRRATVLVVEDDPDTRQSTADVLESAGYHVVTAAHGRDAFQHLESMDPPGLILLDLMMPMMSGREFLVARRGRDALARIPVVIMSAWRRDAEREEGAQGFIAKPVDIDVLLHVVEEYCSRCRESSDSTTG